MWYYKSKLYETFSQDKELLQLSLEKIPEQCKKPNTDLNSVEDVRNLFHTISHWDVYEFPRSLFEYFDSNKFKKNDYEEFSCKYSKLFDVLKQISFHKYEKALEVFHFDETFKYIVDTNKLKNNRDICNYAAKNGYLNCLIYAHEHGYQWDSITCLCAVMEGHLDCFQYAHEHGCEWNNQSIYIAAAESGHLNCLIYAHVHAHERSNQSVYIVAAKSDHLNCLIYEIEFEHLNSNVCIFAARRGHLDCIKYAHKHRCELSPAILVEAVEHNHLDCLQYAHEHGCELFPELSRLAAIYGNLDCLKYLHQNGCEWHSMTCLFAAIRGHLDCLKYAIENGCPLDKYICFRDSFKYPEIQKYLLTL